jgi:hypothetical protein
MAQPPRRLAALLVLALILPHHAADEAPTGWRRCVVQDFDAVADDGVADSAAIHLAALRACGGPTGGEIVLRGPGAYESAPMNLTSNQALRVAAGAVLLGLYPIVTSQYIRPIATAQALYTRFSIYPSESYSVAVFLK